MEARSHWLPEEVEEGQPSSDPDWHTTGNQGPQWHKMKGERLRQPGGGGRKGLHGSYAATQQIVLRGAQINSVPPLNTPPPKIQSAVLDEIYASPLP